LVGEIGFREAVLSAARRVSLVLVTKLDAVSTLPSTIPQVEHEVAHEADVAVLDIDGSSQSADVLGHVVAEDY